MYVGYVTPQEYTEAYQGSRIPEDQQTQSLREASRHVDALTFGRITAQGFDNLTQYQRELVQEVVCQLAEWEYDNADELQALLSAYSINGVSMQFGGAGNIWQQGGVYLPASLYAKLAQTGLCCRLAV